MTAAWCERIRQLDTVRRTGRLRAIHATALEADGPSVPLGSLVAIEGHGANGPARVHAEVIRVGPDRIMLATLEESSGLVPGALVTAVATPNQVRVGQGFLGRAVDALGRPLDGDLPPLGDAHAPLHGEAPAPLARTSSLKRLETGIRVIDTLLPLAQGQRIGVFAAAGVGKTSLLAQLAQQTEADVTILALIGERGREVEALWARLSESVRRRATLVAATSDLPATMRVRAVHHAMAQAEHWRRQGRHVLLLIDSITRLAMALREIGLAAGEPPTARAYTPNVFAALPHLVERAGALRAGGAISAIMTVLSEADEVDDPISEVMKSLLDGHLILSRALSEQAHFPAIDVLRSVSRQAPELMSPAQRERARQVGRLLAAFDQSRMAREAGLYVTGSDATIDAAVATRAPLIAFLQQSDTHRASREEAERSLERLVGREMNHA